MKKSSRLKQKWKCIYLLTFPAEFEKRKKKQKKTKKTM